MHNSKECFKCGSVKSLTEFYKHKGMADGHLNKCKECNKTDTKNNYSRNIDYYKEYDRQRSMLKENIERRNRYIQTEAGKESARKSKQKWQEENVIKRSANLIVGSAIKSGLIIKHTKCESCGQENKRLHGHHDDYNYPLSVRWLCPKCHTEWHKLNGSGING